MDNSLTPGEVRGAYLWFFGVGALAIGIAFSLFRIDSVLTASTREVQLNNTLKEIRSGQASFETRNLDHRLLVTQSVHGSK